MTIVLLSGGSGKRLWPLSNEMRSKQFLKLLCNENDCPESMVQRVYRQIRESGINANILIAANSAQTDSIRCHLGKNVDIVMEPSRRDTFPAIALSTMYLCMVQNCPLDEVVVALPVDPFADSDYFEALQEMADAVENDVAELVLMGIKPTYVSEKYGYIVPCSGEERVKKVSYFVEKPDEKRARDMIAKGAVWNGGAFAFRAKYITNIVKHYVNPVDYADLLEHYDDLPKISFDYEVVEKAKSVAVVSYNGVWKDLGTWNTLTEEMKQPYLGNVIVGEDICNTHVINELDIPMVVLGVKNVVVAASPDGILVSSKNASSFLKPYVNKISMRPMYEERSWGEYKVLQYNQVSNDEKSLTRHMFVRNGMSISYHRHMLRDEIWTFIEGSGDLVIDGHTRNVRRGDVAYITKSQLHAVRANTDLHFIEVQIGTNLIDSDKEKFEYKW